MNTCRHGSTKGKCRNVNSLSEILSKYECLYLQHVLWISKIISVDFCALAFYIALYFNVCILALASHQCVTLLIMLQ
jgi:hypothetical protein